MSDVDVAIEMPPKLNQASHQQHAEADGLLAARRAGRRFRNLAEEVWWPKQLQDPIRLVDADGATATPVLFAEVRIRKTRSAQGHDA